MDESYGKCRTCRLCIHRDEVWVCAAEDRSTQPDSGCGRWRPGCCENCRSYSSGRCGDSGLEMYPMDVCDNYDPAGPRRSRVGEALLPVGDAVLDARLSL